MLFPPVWPSGSNLSQHRTCLRGQSKLRQPSYKGTDGRAPAWVPGHPNAESATEIQSYPGLSLPITPGIVTDIWGIEHRVVLHSSGLCHGPRPECSEVSNPFYWNKRTIYFSGPIIPSKMHLPLNPGKDLPGFRPRVRIYPT